MALQISTAGALLVGFLGLPLQRFREISELRRLQRKMPRSHRGWTVVPRGIRPETDAEYLGRLQRMINEDRQRRAERGPSSADGGAVSRTQPLPLFTTLSNGGKRQMF